MASYGYNTAQVDRRTTRRLESTFLVGLGLMVAFLVSSFVYRDQFGQFLKSDQRLFPLILVGLYLFFLVPSRRLLRIQRSSQTSVVTTRKGFTYRDFQGEKILSWRDVKQARIQLDADRSRQAFPSRIVLVHAKGRIALENEPPGTELLGAADLAREIRRRVPDLTFSFHWFHPVCPFCKADLPRTERSCPSCHEPVRYVPKVLRPWELLREEGLYLVLILAVVNLWPLVLLYLASLLLFPFVLQRRSQLKTVDLAVAGGEDRDEPSAAEPASRAGTATVLAVALASLLLLAAPAVEAAPSASPSPSASPAPVGSPSQATLPWFPLAVGNRWEYRSNYNKVSMRVTGVENVDGVPCFVLHSFVGESKESSQVEYLSVTDEGVRVLKRTHKGSDFIVLPPEPILAYPLEVGTKWSWQGDASTGNTALYFTVRPGGVLQVLGRRVPTLLVVLTGRSSDGSELQTKRWYSRGLGMVRELTQMKKGTRSLKVEAQLVNFEAGIR